MDGLVRPYPVRVELLEDDLDPARWAPLCSGPGHHPGGGAHVPAALRALAGAHGHEDARRRADRLWDLVFHSHSGCYLMPVVPVVPQLVRLATAGDPVVRAATLGFLVAVAGGTPSWADTCPGAEDLERRANAAVRAGAVTYYAQLDAADPVVRATAFVLITVIEHRPLRRLKGAAFTAALQGPPITSQSYRTAVARLRDDPDPHVQWRLRQAAIDPLFGDGAEYRGVDYEY